MEPSYTWFLPPRANLKQAPDYPGSEPGAWDAGLAWPAVLPVGFMEPSFSPNPEKGGFHPRRWQLRALVHRTEDPNPKQARRIKAGLLASGQPPRLFKPKRLHALAMPSCPRASARPGQRTSRTTLPPTAPTGYSPTRHPAVAHLVERFSLRPISRPRLALFPLPLLPPLPPRGAVQQGPLRRNRRAGVRLRPRCAASYIVRHTSVPARLAAQGSRDRCYIWCFRRCPLVAPDADGFRLVRIPLGKRSRNKRLVTWAPGGGGPEDGTVGSPDPTWRSGLDDGPLSPRDRDTRPPRPGAAVRT